MEEIIRGIGAVMIEADVPATVVLRFQKANPINGADVTIELVFPKDAGSKR
jgi:hypothetical protein